MGRNILISNTGGTFVYARNVNPVPLAKSQTARSGNLVEVAITRMEQVGRSEMTAEEKYLAGGAFLGMFPRPAVLRCSASTKQAIREALLKSANADACAEFDAGRGRESDLIKALGAVEKAAGGEVEEGDYSYDQDGNLEPMRKSPDSGLFDLRRKGAGAEIVAKAYEAASEDGAVSLREAAAELDAIVERFNKGGR